MTAFALCLLAYVAGSVNFAILVLGAIGREDPRTRFSGNAGTTNVYRQAGRGWAALVLLLDLGRAVAVATAAVHFLPAPLAPWPGFGLIVGNRFPCFHRFRGGKGVAGYLGFTLVLAPPAAGLAALLWVAVYAVVRIPFIASFFMILALAIGTLTLYNAEPAALAGVAASVLLICINHKRNLENLIRERRDGNESRRDASGQHPDPGR